MLPLRVPYLPRYIRATIFCIGLWTTTFTVFLTSACIRTCLFTLLPTYSLLHTALFCVDHTTSHRPTRRVCHTYRTRFRRYLLSPLPTHTTATRATFVHACRVPRGRSHYPTAPCRPWLPYPPCRPHYMRLFGFCLTHSSRCGALHSNSYPLLPPSLTDTCSSSGFLGLGLGNSLIQRPSSRSLPHLRAFAPPPRVPTPTHFIRAFFVHLVHPISPVYTSYPLGWYGLHPHTHTFGFSVYHTPFHTRTTFPSVFILMRLCCYPHCSLCSLPCPTPHLSQQLLPTSHTLVPSHICYTPHSPILLPIVPHMPVLSLSLSHPPPLYISSYTYTCVTLPPHYCRFFYALRTPATRTPPHAYQPTHGTARYVALMHALPCLPTALQRFTRVSFPHTRGGVLFKHSVSVPTRLLRATAALFAWNAGALARCVDQFCLFLILPLTTCWIPPNSMVYGDVIISLAMDG